MNVVEYRDYLSSLSRKFNGVCQCCGKRKGTSWRWIAPPGRRQNKQLEAMTYLCDECLKNGQTKYPWWSGKYGL